MVDTALASLDVVVYTFAAIGLVGNILSFGYKILRPIHVPHLWKYSICLLDLSNACLGIGLFLFLSYHSQVLSSCDVAQVFLLFGLLDTVCNLFIFDIILLVCPRMTKSSDTSKSQLCVLLWTIGPQKIIFIVLACLTLTPSQFFHNDSVYYITCLPLQRSGESGSSYTIILLVLAWMISLPSAALAIINSTKICLAYRNRVHTISSNQSEVESYKQGKFLQTALFLEHVIWIICLLLISIVLYTDAFDSSTAKWGLYLCLSVCVMYNGLMSNVGNGLWSNLCCCGNNQASGDDHRKLKKLELIRVDSPGKVRMKATWLGEKRAQLSGHMKVYGTDHMKGWSQEIVILGMLRKVQHGNILQCLWTNGTNPYYEAMTLITGEIVQNDSRIICLELTEHGSMKDYLKSSHEPLPESTQDTIVYDVVEGLSYLHNLSILHGNVTSSSIYIKQIGQSSAIRAAIGDFEEAEVFSSQLQSTGNFFPSKQRDFLVPDIRSLALVIFELLAIVSARRMKDRNGDISTDNVPLLLALNESPSETKNEHNKVTSTMGSPGNVITGTEVVNVNIGYVGNEDEFETSSVAKESTAIDQTSLCAIRSNDWYSKKKQMPPIIDRDSEELIIEYDGLDMVKKSLFSNNVVTNDIDDEHDDSEKYRDFTDCSVTNREVQRTKTQKQAGDNIKIIHSRKSTSSDAIHKWQRNETHLNQYDNFFSVPGLHVDGSDVLIEEDIFDPELMKIPVKEPANLCTIPEHRSKSKFTFRPLATSVLETGDNDSGIVLELTNDSIHSSLVISIDERKVVSKRSKNDPIVQVPDGKTIELQMTKTGHLLHSVIDTADRSGNGDADTVRNIRAETNRRQANNMLIASTDHNKRSKARSALKKALVNKPIPVPAPRLSKLNNKSLKTIQNLATHRVKPVNIENLESTDEKLDFDRNPSFSSDGSGAGSINSIQVKPANVENMDLNTKHVDIESEGDKSIRKRLLEICTQAGHVNKLLHQKAGKLRSDSGFESESTSSDSSHDISVTRMLPIDPEPDEGIDNKEDLTLCSDTSCDNKAIRIGGFCDIHTSLALSNKQESPSKSPQSIYSHPHVGSKRYRELTSKGIPMRVSIISAEDPVGELFSALDKTASDEVFKTVKLEDDNAVGHFKDSVGQFPSSKLSLIPSVPKQILNKNENHTKAASVRHKTLASPISTKFDNRVDNIIRASRASLGDIIQEAPDNDIRHIQYEGYYPIPNQPLEDLPVPRTLEPFVWQDCNTPSSMSRPSTAEHPEQGIDRIYTQKTPQTPDRKPSQPLCELLQDEAVKHLVSGIALMPGVKAKHVKYCQELSTRVYLLSFNDLLPATEENMDNMATKLEHAGCMGSRVKKLMALAKSCWLQQAPPMLDELRERLQDHVMETQV